jgi:hypothetical protein
MPKPVVIHVSLNKTHVNHYVPSPLMTANFLKANWNQFLPKGSYRLRVTVWTLTGGNPMKLKTNDSVTRHGWLEIHVSLFERVQF